MPAWIVSVLGALWDNEYVSSISALIIMDLRSCITVAGGFISFCLGYTCNFENIDIFCTKEAFEKLIQKIGELNPAIRLVR